MPDYAKIKRNVAKMIDMDAPESDIDRYIRGEGATVEEIQRFKPFGTERTVRERVALKLPFAGLRKFAGAPPHRRGERSLFGDIARSGAASRAAIIEGVKSGKPGIAFALPHAGLFGLSGYYGKDVQKATKKGIL
jgi:hypothetical protein